MDRKRASPPERLQGRRVRRPRARLGRDSRRGARRRAASAGAGERCEEAELRRRRPRSSASTSPRRNQLPRREPGRAGGDGSFDPPRARRARSVRARQAGGGGSARARARAGRQARVERRAVRAVPGRAGGDRPRDARAEPLPGRRRVAASKRARRAARRRASSRSPCAPVPTRSSATSAWRPSIRATRSSPAGRRSRATSSTR